jgi:hypothetical protein
MSKCAIIPDRRIFRLGGGYRDGSRLVNTTTANEAAIHGQGFYDLTFHDSGFGRNIRRRQ